MNSQLIRFRVFIAALTFFALLVLLGNSPGLPAVQQSSYLSDCSFRLKQLGLNNDFETTDNVLLPNPSAWSGLPEIIIIDNGPEFIGKALDAWAYQRGVKLTFIRPGKPVENAYIESFNGRFRDECLNENWFLTLEHTRGIIEKWRIDYNNERPHSSLGYLTPEEFLRLENEKFSTGMPVEAGLINAGYSNS